MSTPPRRNFGFSRTKEQKPDRPQRSSERRAPVRGPKDRKAILFVPRDEHETDYAFKTRVAAVSLAFGGNVVFGEDLGRYLERLTYGFRADLLADPEISPLVQAIRGAVDAASKLIAKRLAALPPPTASEQQESEVESSQPDDNSQE